MTVLRRGEPWQTKRLLPAGMYSTERLQLDISFDTNLVLSSVAGGVPVEVATFRLGAGIGVEGTPPDQILLSTAANDTQNWPVGDYEWTLNVYGSNGEPVLTESGTFSMTDDPAEVTKPVKPWDFFRPSMHSISDEAVQARLAICHDCPLFNGVLCTVCSCVMEAKARLAPATCPVEKW